MADKGDDLTLRLRLRRLEVDWLHADLHLALSQAAINNQAQKKLNLSNTESRARGITLKRHCFRSHVWKRFVDHLAHTEHKRPEPIKTHEESVAVKVCGQETRQEHESVLIELQSL